MAGLIDHPSIPWIPNVHPVDTAFLFGVNQVEDALLGSTAMRVLAQSWAVIH